MKKFFNLVVLLFVLAGRASASPVPLDSASFDFDSIALSDLVRVVYVQAFSSVPYTVDPAVLQDKRPVSFRYKTGDGDFRAVFSSFLHGLSYELLTRGRLDVERPLPPGPTEVKPSAVEDREQKVFVYRPRFRFGNKSNEKSESEIQLFLQLKKI